MTTKQIAGDPPGQFINHSVVPSPLWTITTPVTPPPPSAPSPDKLLYTMAEACELTGLCRKTLERAVRDGDLVETRPTPRSVRFSRADLEAYCAKKRATRAA